MADGEDRNVPGSIRAIEGGEAAIAEVGGIPYRPVDHLIPNVDDEDYQSWFLGFNNAAYLEYANETFIDEDGVQRKAGDFFFELLNDPGYTEATIGPRLEYVLAPREVNGILYRGATWFNDWAQSFVDNEQRIIDFNASDGAAQANQVANVAANIRDRAAKLGLVLTEDDVQQMATIAVTSNWNDARILDRLLENFNYGELQTGDITTFVDNLEMMATDYLVTFTPDRLQDMAQRVFSGELSETTVNQMIRDQAAAEMPFLQSYLDRGLKPIDAFGSLIGTAARELEMDASNISLMDPKWRDVMIKQNDDGSSRLATMSEVRTFVRDLPEWQNTEAARNTAQELGVALGSIFGRGFRRGGF